MKPTPLKTLYAGEYEYIFTAMIGDLMARAISRRINDLVLTEEEMNCFIQYYNDVLPHDWDRKSFRGCTLYLDTEI